MLHIHVPVTEKEQVDGENNDDINNNLGLIQLDSVSSELKEWKADAKSRKKLMKARMKSLHTSIDEGLTSAYLLIHNEVDQSNESFVHEERVQEIEQRLRKLQDMAVPKEKIKMHARAIKMGQNALELERKNALAEKEHQEELLAFNELAQSHSDLRKLLCSIFFDSEGRMPTEEELQTSLEEELQPLFANVKEELKKSEEKVRKHAQVRVIARHVSYMVHSKSPETDSVIAQKCLDYFSLISDGRDRIFVSDIRPHKQRIRKLLRHVHGHEAEKVKSTAEIVSYLDIPDAGLRFAEFTDKILRPISL